MTSFSERMGITQPKAIQIADLDMELRNSLWNLCRSFWFVERDRLLEDDDDIYRLAQNIYKEFYKRPVDDLQSFTSDFVAEQLETFRNALWYDVLNFVEFLHTQIPDVGANRQSFEHKINKVLEREKSAYRFIAGKLAPITNEIEMQELEKGAQHRNRFAPVAQHVRTALELYSKKPQPDYLNSIKESISAVESAAKIITNLPNATLADAIKEIERRHSLHKAFKDGILKLYGYTSDQGGIRHGLTESTNIDEADARYMLVSCSAFANYLISRFDK
jgi:hypothetical protein